MSLDYAWQVFYAAVQEAVASQEPLRRRAERLCAATLDKLRGNEGLREDLQERLGQVREMRTRIGEMRESEVRDLLKEIVSIYDAISAQLYSSGRTKTVGNV
jgi:chromosome condensin MukBEF ATPase and DNA-binding subunit MukB